MNRQLAFAEYLREEPGGAFKALAVTLVALNRDGTRIAEKVSFVQPTLFALWGLPTSLE
jgi:hypothetical protein